MEAKDNGTTYELEVTIARIHKRHSELFDDPALKEDPTLNEDGEE
jgi:hypothetical protein